MARIIDAVNAARESGEWPDDLESIYNEDVAEISGPFEGKIAELESAITEGASNLEAANGEISRLKAHNYDLMRSTGAGEPADEVEEAESSPSTIDELFK